MCLSVCVELIKDAAILGDREGEARICPQVRPPPFPLPPPAAAARPGCAAAALRRRRLTRSPMETALLSAGLLTTKLLQSEPGASTEVCEVSASHHCARPSSEKLACGLDAMRLSRASLPHWPQVLPRKPVLRLPPGKALAWSAGSVTASPPPPSLSCLPCPQDMRHHGGVSGPWYNYSPGGWAGERDQHTHTRVRIPHACIHALTVVGRTGGVFGS